MARKSNGSIHLFQAFGIDVFLHWSWFIVAIIQYQYAAQHSFFITPTWNILVYLTLFGIVTLHEFGHALACRSVGGQAERIILWPLGGIAFVNPPQRPGPVLWSIAAGPLVNVVLLPVTLGLLYLVHVPINLLDVSAVVVDNWTDPQRFVVAVTIINAFLLVFNLLPIYPLDGGQIFQSILWFFLSRAKSLLIATSIGLIGAVVGLVYGVYIQDWFLLALAAFVGYEAYKGFVIARKMAAYEAAANQRARSIAGVDQ